MAKQANEIAPLVSRRLLARETAGNASLNPDRASGKFPHNRGVKFPLSILYPSMKSRRGVPFQNRHRLLSQYRPGIHALIHKMNGATRHFYSIG